MAAPRAPSPDVLASAMQAMHRADALFEKHEYLEAQTFYLQAAEIFLVCIKDGNPMAPGIENSAKQSANHCISRAEEIKRMEQATAAYASQHPAVPGSTAGAARSTSAASTPPSAGITTPSAASGSLIDRVAAMRRGSGGSTRDFTPDITALRTQITALETKLREAMGAAPQPELARLRHDVDAAAERATHAEEGLDAMRRSTATDTDGIRQLRDRIAKNERDLLELQAELEAERTKNSALVRRVAALEGSMGRLDALEVLVRTLETNVDTLAPRG